MDLLASPWHLKPDVVVRPETDGYLLYNPATDQLHLISGEGHAFLQMLDGTRTLESAISDFVTGLEPTAAEHAKWLTLLFVKNLVERKLLDA